MNIKCKFKIKLYQRKKLFGVIRLASSRISVDANSLRFKSRFTNPTDAKFLAEQ